MFPASAGMIPRQNKGNRGRAHVPRKSGDDPSGNVIGEYERECSPQARG